MDRQSWGLQALLHLRDVRAGSGQSTDEKVEDGLQAQGVRSGRLTVERFPRPGTELEAPQGRLPAVLRGDFRHSEQHHPEANDPHHGVFLQRPGQTNR